MTFVVLLVLAVVDPPSAQRGQCVCHRILWQVPRVAQAPAEAVVREPTLQLDWGIERRRDRLRYRFENRSIFDTIEVEHFFQQRYSADHTWLVARAAYRKSASRRWVAEGGMAPSIATFGEDLDTFFNPGNNVIVSGTSGEVRMHSTRASGWIEHTPTSGRVDRIGYSYRRDVSHFRTPERKIVTMSNPPSTEESITFDRETTISQVHQVWIGLTRRRALPRRWRIDLEGSASPATLARLNTRLPEKYPGRDVVFWAAGFEVAGRLTLARGARWPVSLSADIGRTFPYIPSARFIRTSLGVSATVGFAP